MTREELFQTVELLRDTAKLHQPNEEILTDVKAESFIFVMDSVLSALSVPEREKGEWITDETSGSALNDRYYCSSCGKELKMPYAVIKAEQKNGKYLFCDRCGADMRGE